MRFSARLEKVFVGWFLGILSALVIALGALWVINRTVYDPAGQVRQYLQALREGDGSHALGILGAEVPKDASAAMLDGEGARKALEGLDNISVKTTNLSDGEHATVRVTYSVAGQEKSSDFHLSKVGSHWGVFDQWHIDKAELPRLKVSSTTAEAATLNNVKVSVADGEREFAVFYPGLYTATYESALYSAESASALVSAGDSAASVKVKLAPSEAAINSVKYQIKSQLDSCAAQNSLYPTGCPFEYAFSGRVEGNLVWTITQYPEPVATIDKSGKWVLPKSSGKAQISFTELDLYTGKTKQVSKEVSFDYTGTLSLDGENVTVTATS